MQRILKVVLLVAALAFVPAANGVLPFSGAQIGLLVALGLALIIIGRRMMRTARLRRAAALSPERVGFVPEWASNERFAA